MADFAFAFLDCEFGGLDVEAHDITEIGVIVADYRLKELATGHWRVKFDFERSNPEARKIFGYDEKLWADAVPLRQALEEFTALLPEGKTVVPAGQNVRMDVLYLERGWKNSELPYPFDYHVIDLASLFYAWSLVAGEKVPALSLRQAATTAGLINGQVPHRALDDARLTLETFRHYVGALAVREPETVPALRAGETGETEDAAISASDADSA